MEKIVGPFPFVDSDCCSAAMRWKHDAMDKKPHGPPGPRQHGQAMPETFPNRDRFERELPPRMRIKSFDARAGGLSGALNIGGNDYDISGSMIW